MVSYCFGKFHSLLNIFYSCNLKYVSVWNLFWGKEKEEHNFFLKFLEFYQPIFKH